MKLDEFSVLGFVIGYFIFMFVIAFWSEPFSLEFLNKKLFWSIAGMLGAILVGIINAK
jgi:hypothetical protein